MRPERFQAITQRYRSLRTAVIGDFCLDRYLEIDPSRKEISIETNLPVYNVSRVRSQPGGAGTILNNLVALGVGEIQAIGFCGEDGEGFELERSLGARTGVRLDSFIQTSLRRTFSYTKPLQVESGKAPLELNRLDFKNWSPTPPRVREQISSGITRLAGQIDAAIVLDQVDLADTGVITAESLQAVETLTQRQPGLFIIADSRRTLRGFPPVAFKMNRAEFEAFTGSNPGRDLAAVRAIASNLAAQNRRHVFVTLAEGGILGASPEGEVEHAAALPVRGPIDIVGAGDAVTANLTAALSSGASLREALELAMLAASIVVHQLGTTGTASVDQLAALHDAVNAPRASAGG